MSPMSSEATMSARSISRTACLLESAPSGIMNSKRSGMPVGFAIVTETPRARSKCHNRLAADAVAVGVDMGRQHHVTGARQRRRHVARRLSTIRRNGDAVRVHCGKIIASYPRRLAPLDVFRQAPVLLSFTRRLTSWPATRTWSAGPAPAPPASARAAGGCASGYSRSRSRSR